jgi:hypothetical protein
MVVPPEAVAGEARFVAGAAKASVADSFAEASAGAKASADAAVTSGECVEWREVVESHRRRAA